MAKLYGVGVSTGYRTVRLETYNSKNLWNGDGTRGLTYQQIFGNAFMGPMFESTRKKDCLDYIKKEFNAKDGWTLVDNTVKN